MMGTGVRCGNMRNLETCQITLCQIFDENLIILFNGTNLILLRSQSESLQISFMHRKLPCYYHFKHMNEKRFSNLILPTIYR